MFGSNGDTDSRRSEYVFVDGRFDRQPSDDAGINRNDDLYGNGYHDGALQQYGSSHGNGNCTSDSDGKLPCDMRGQYGDVDGEWSDDLYVDGRFER